MSNPIVTRNPYFSNGRPNFGGQGTQADRSAAGWNVTTAGQSAFVNADRMTYEDALNKVGLLLGLAVVSGLATAFLMSPASYGPVAMVSVLAAFVVGLILAFQRMVSPGLAIAYSVLEGVALGAMTRALDLVIPGIALQTILATAVIVGVTFGLHYSGKVRTTPKGRKVVLVVALGAIVFSLINFVLMLLGVFNNQAWGIRGMEFGGIPLGVVLGFVMIAVAGYMLIADFEAINVAIINGAPRKFAWTTGIAIVMTILWIYVEVLRILAILNSRD